MANTLFSAHTSHWNGRVGSNLSNRPHPPNPSNPSNHFVRHTYSGSPSFNAHHPQTYWSQWCSQYPLHLKNGKNRRTHPPSPQGWWMVHCLWALDGAAWHCQIAFGFATSSGEATFYSSGHCHSAFRWGQAIGFGCLCMSPQCRKAQIESSH